MNGPDFLIIGAQWCGTHWLHDQLCLHPEVSFPGGKETHFWSLHRKKGVKWYSGLFSDGAARMGDVSASYATLSPNIICKIAELWPDLKIIYLTRDPLERALAGLNAKARSLGTGLEALPEAVVRNLIESRENILMSAHESCLRNWQAFFPAEAFAVFDYSEIRESPAGVLSRIAGHVGAAPAFFEHHEEERLRRGLDGGGGAEPPPGVIKLVAGCLASPAVAALCEHQVRLSPDNGEAGAELARLTRRNLARGWFDKDEVRSIQFSSTPVFLPGWLNLSNEAEVDYGWVPVEFSKGLFFADETFDECYVRLVLEAVKYETCVRFLAEIFHIMKKGGRLRLHCRDLEAIASLVRPEGEDDLVYIETAVERLFPGSDFYSGAQVMRHFVGNPRVKTLLCAPELQEILGTIGFQGIGRYAANEGPSALRRADLVIEGPTKVEERMSMFMECVKPY